MAVGIPVETPSTNPTAFTALAAAVAAGGGALIDSASASIGMTKTLVARPVAHWDFSALSNLADGATIASVRDVSGNGANLYANTLRPTKATDSNGKAVARFSGTNQRLVAETFGVAEPAQNTLGAPASVVMVVKPSAFASQTSQAPVLLQGNGTNAPTISILNDNTTHAGVVFVGGNTLSNNSGQFMPSILDGNYHVIVVTSDSAVTTVYVDGYYVSTITGNVFGTALTKPFIGIGNGGGATLYAGDMAEIALFNARLTADEVMAVTSALNTKWGIGLSLYSNTADGANFYLDSSTSDGSNTRIWTPAQPAASPVLMIFCHPQSGDRNVTPSYWAYPYIRTAMGLGWYTAASDMGYSGSPGGSASSWGNATAQNALALLYADMVSRIGATPKVVLIGASMGGMASATAAIKATLPIDAIYFVDPALSLWDMYKTSYSSSIDSGFSITASTLAASSLAGATSVSSNATYANGTVLALIDTGGANAEQATVQSVTGSGPYTITFTTPLANAHASGAKISDYGTKTATYDPMLASTAAFVGKPIRYTASSGDGLVPIAQNAQAFQTKLNGIATGNVIVSHQGGHLVGGSANPGDMLRFLKANGF